MNIWDHIDPKYRDDPRFRTSEDGESVYVGLSVIGTTIHDGWGLWVRKGVSAWLVDHPTDLDANPVLFTSAGEAVEFALKHVPS